MRFLLKILTVPFVNRSQPKCSYDVYNRLKSDEHIFFLQPLKLARYLFFLLWVFWKCCLGCDLKIPTQSRLRILVWHMPSYILGSWDCPEKLHGWIHIILSKVKSGGPCMLFWIAIPIKKQRSEKSRRCNRKMWIWRFFFGILPSTNIGCFPILILVLFLNLHLVNLKCRSRGATKMTHFKIVGFTNVHFIVKNCQVTKKIKDVHLDIKCLIT